MMTWDSRQDIKVKFTPPNSSITMRTRLHAACNAMAGPISDPFSYEMQTFLQNFDTNVLVIRLEARLRPNIGFTLSGNLAVFKRSDVTPPNLNRFG